VADRARHQIVGAVEAALDTVRETTGRACALSGTQNSNV
jgi:hypothetical protein